MKRDEFNAYCGSKPGTSHVVQWGNSDVWKVGGKLFAVCGWNSGQAAYTFKVTPLVFELFVEADGYRPAPYLASRGMSWLQITDPEAAGRDALKQHLDVSYALVAEKLPKKFRAELGLLKG
ncbi:MAG: MmcQ/YjbR family DNA-binding protein [Marinovum sp.]|nr:MmcQ/YjbR family DNA-binding protein [Marinovum sp.]